MAGSLRPAMYFMENVLIVINIVMIIIGVFAIGWGLWASFNLKKPFDIIGAVCAPIGLVLALIGTLLIGVPRFFS